MATDRFAARAAGCAVRRTLGAVLGGLALALLLGACEEATAPKTAAMPSQPAPEPRAQSTCVPNVKIHGTDTGGAIQGAIKESVLYWAGTESDVECVGESQRQEQRVGSTEGNVTTYRVIRVQESVGDRYYILKYVNGEPVCIIDVTGACERKLSALGDYDVATLPETVPELGGSETRPTPPPPTTAPATPGGSNPPDSQWGVKSIEIVVAPGGTPATPSGTLQERYTVGLADGPVIIINNLADFFVDPEGGRVTITNVTSSDERIATVAVVSGGLQVTPINLGTATVTISAGRSAPATPEDGPATPEDDRRERHTVRLSEGATIIINNVVDLFMDPDGGHVTIATVTSSAERIATVAMVDGNLQVTPVNVGTATVTISASSGSNPPDPQWGVKSVEVAVIP